MVPLLCLTFLLPACAVLFHYRESFANQLTFPTHSDTSIAYQHLTREFPAGKLSPQYVLLPASNGSVRSDEFFDASCHLAQILLEDLSVPPFNLQASDLLGAGPFATPSGTGRARERFGFEVPSMELHEERRPASLRAHSPQKRSWSFPTTLVRPTESNGATWSTSGRGDPFRFVVA